ncbi:phosphatidylserine/phosphatidylglycerophosphate/cardiolipin synthase family protein [Halosolutus amylolyticus]|uniref:Phosphatidylserine/phosphatidylglycerophosphate/ cardiolipin synthase family protein n=1 Tax=Halosolutus amylolyticus TaxID=2932267 RepID=A0ABD5PPR0_9EURY|nr:phospholipase D-like domain-containing protein [Halosolutus amylolyticus]
MSRTRRSLLRAVGSTGVVGSVVLGSDTNRAWSSRGSAPRIEPIFSYPSPLGRPDDVHERTILDLLHRAVPGTAVHLSLYAFTRTNVARACLAAADRGVDVNVLVDDHLAEADAVQRLRGRSNDRVSITADGGIGVSRNHNKFLLVEELNNGESNVVWQSSSNLTNTQRFLHNTSVVFRGAGDLYDVYREYWNELAAGDSDPHYNRTAETDSATVYFSPRSDFDTHLAALENVVPSRDATIRFMYSIWNEKRPAIVDRIAELVDAGCTVEVILNGEKSDIGQRLRRAGADVLEYPTTTVGRVTPWQSPNVHSKTMLVDADVDVDGETRRRRLVYTGSQNLSRNGLLANDETLLRIEDDDVYAQFVRDWKRVHEQGRRLASDGAMAIVRSLW